MKGTSNLVKIGPWKINNKLPDKVEFESMFKPRRDNVSRYLMDQSRSYVGNKYWFLLVDEFTKISWRKFRKTKSEPPELIFPLLKQLYGVH